MKQYEHNNNDQKKRNECFDTHLSKKNMNKENIDL